MFTVKRVAGNVRSFDYGRQKCERQRNIRRRRDMKYDALYFHHYVTEYIPGALDERDATECSVDNRV